MTALRVPPGDCSHESPPDPFQIAPRLPHEFIGREADLALVEARVYAGESTVIVSELPHGRTSMLRRIEHTFRESGRRTHFVDAFRLPQDEPPNELWRRIEGRLKIDAQRSAPAYNEPSAPILLIDDLHVLLARESVRASNFLGLLRSLTSLRVLNFVGASARDLVALSELLGAPWGSPLLNTYREQRLGPLCSRDADEVLMRAGDELTASDRRFVVRGSGGQPKILNLIASQLLYVNRTSPQLDPTSRRHLALRQLRGDLGSLLRDLWSRLSSDERRCLLNICAGSACRSSIPSGEPLDWRRDPVSATDGQRFGAVVRFLHCVSRSLLRQAVRERVGAMAVAELPSDAVPDAAFYFEAAQHLECCKKLSAVLEWLGHRPEVPRSDLQQLLSVRAAPDPPSPASADLAVDRLLESGLVQTSLVPPGWEIRPWLLSGWLRDYIRAPDLLRKLVEPMGDAFDCGPIERFVAAHPTTFEPGAARLFEELCHEPTSD